MPNLDNLRKQAKQLLRWHRDGRYPVAAEIRAWLSRYDGLTDAEILAAPFKLADAQQMVARRLGFENWLALKAGAPAMTTQEKIIAPNAILIATEASLYVADFQRARDYYVEKLGFVLEFSYGDPPFYGLVKRDDARLCLRRVGGPVFVEGIREREQLLSASFTLGAAPEIKKLFHDFRAAGVDFFKALGTEPWGARTFIVRDPDGNLVMFAARSE